MTGYRVLATLTLKSAADRGLETPLPAGTRSVLLRFPPTNSDQAEPVTLGAALTPWDGSDLTPGSEVEAEALFWTDEARIHATVGASFDLWYGRDVGHGTVTGVADDLADQH
jgi:hypothetical protein